MMNAVVNKVKGRGSSETQETQSEQQFGILPHPAKTNNPADLQPQPGAGLNSGHAYQAHHAHGPVVPNDGLKNNIEQPASRDELRARAAELNK